MQQPQPQLQQQCYSQQQLQQHQEHNQQQNLHQHQQQLYQNHLHAPSWAPLRSNYGDYNKDDGKEDMAVAKSFLSSVTLTP